MLCRLFSFPRLRMPNLKFRFTLITEQNLEGVVKQFANCKALSEVGEYMRHENAFPLMNIFSRKELSKQLPLAGITQLQTLLENYLPKTAEQLTQAHFCKFRILFNQDKIEEAEAECKTVIKIGNMFSLDVSDLQLNMEIDICFRNKQKIPQKDLMLRFEELCGPVDLKECELLLEKNEADWKKCHKITSYLKSYAFVKLHLSYMYADTDQAVKSLQSVLNSLQACYKIPYELLSRFEVFYLGLLQCYQCYFTLQDIDHILEIAQKSLQIFSQWPEAQVYDEVNYRGYLRLTFLNGMMTFQRGEKQQHYAKLMEKSLNDYKEKYDSVEFMRLEESGYISMELMKTLTQN